MFENFGIQAVQIDDQKNGALSRFQDEVTLASNQDRPLPSGIHAPARVQCENEYNQVLKTIRGIDWDHIPAPNWKPQFQKSSAI